MVILQCDQHVTISIKIRQRIDRRLDAWDAGESGMLVEDTAHTYAQYLSNRRGKDTVEHQAKIFHSLVLRGKLCYSILRITEGEKGGVFQPVDICPKIGKPVF